MAQNKAFLSSNNRKSDEESNQALLDHPNQDSIKTVSNNAFLNYFNSNKDPKPNTSSPLKNQKLNSSFTEEDEVTKNIKTESI